MQAIFFNTETYTAILLILNDDKNTTQSRWIKIYSSKILFTSFHLNNQGASFENEALENEDRSAKHPKTENSKTKTPKSRKRSTQSSKPL